MFDFNKKCPKCGKKSLFLGFCHECRHIETLCDPFISEKIKPIDISGSFSSSSFMAKNGHADFVTEYELKDWHEDDSFKFPMPKYF